MTLEERNDLLTRAKARVLQGWTQGAYGRTADGAAIDTDAPDDLAAATCLCATGAIALVCRNREEDNLLNRTLEQALAELGEISAVVAYNDTPGRTKYEVAALFDQAMLRPLDASV